jgi:hypothetical protein
MLPHADANRFLREQKWRKVSSFMFSYANTRRWWIRHPRYLFHSLIHNLNVDQVRMLCGALLVLDYMHNPTIYAIEMFAKLACY